MTVSEHSIQSQIQVELSKHHCTVFRANVGTGLPSGYTDLSGFRWVDGKAFFIEVKNATGKPREDQIRFHRMLASHNIIHGIARSVDDARMIVDGALVGYGFDDYGSEVNDFDS